MSENADNETSNDEYSMRDDQRIAMDELDRIQKVSPNDWNDERDQQFFQLLMEPPTDYEETVARLDSLNAELKREPMPPDDEERPTRIRFSQELIQVAPSPSPPPQDYDSSSPRESNHTFSDDADPPTEGKVVEDYMESDSTSNKNNAEIVSDEPTASLRSDSPEVQHSTSGDAAGGSSSEKVDAKTEPTFNRNGQTSGVRLAASPRSNTSTASNDEGFQFWLQAKAQQKREEERRELERKQRQDEAVEMERKKRMEKQKMFEVWLKEKQNQAKQEEMQRRERENAEKQQRDKEAEEKRKKLPTFEQWLAGKRTQSARERAYTRAEQEEALNSSRGHTPRQARRSYRLWLRHKSEQERREAQEMQQRLRIANLAMRRTRRSRELADAMLAANSYRYLDYYGYR